MPRNLTTPAALVPRTAPSRVETTGAFGSAAAAEAVRSARMPRLRSWLRMARFPELNFIVRNAVARSMESAAQPSEVVYGREGDGCRPPAALPIAAEERHVTSSQLPRQRERVGVRRER